MNSRFFETPNPHVVGSLIETSKRRRLVASEDIRDSNGLKLLARDMPVTEALRERLADRRLQQPLEACLGVEDGVTGRTLADGAEAAVACSAALQALGGEHAREVFAAMRAVGLQGPTQLLMTAAADDGSALFAHGVVVSYISGVLGLRTGFAGADLEQLLAGGLLHDVGEMYLAPGQRQAAGELPFEAWRATATHPKISTLVLSELGRYPKPVTTAVLEHHERIDGSGYPERRQGSELSRIGRVVLVAEALAGILQRRPGPQSRALIGLRLVRGQFPEDLVRYVADTLRPDIDGLPEGYDGPRLADEARQLADGLREAGDLAAQLLAMPGLGAAERGALTRARDLCLRLRVAFSATGADQLGLVPGVSLDDPQAAIELDVAVREMQWQVRALARDLAHVANDGPAPSAWLMSVAHALQLAGPVPPAA